MQWGDGDGDGEGERRIDYMEKGKQASDESTVHSVTVQLRDLMVGSGEE